MKWLLLLAAIGCGRLDVAGKYRAGFFWAQDPSVGLVCTWNDQPVAGEWELRQDPDGRLSGTYEICGESRSDLRGFVSLTDAVQFTILDETVMVSARVEDSGALVSYQVLGIGGTVFRATRVER